MAPSATALIAPLVPMLPGTSMVTFGWSLVKASAKRRVMARLTPEPAAVSCTGGGAGCCSARTGQGMTASCRIMVQQAMNNQEGARTRMVFS